jgi:D-alanyl-D-alanine carboxypeptidase
MNLKRAIGGPILSIFFLILFVYTIFGVQDLVTFFSKFQNSVSAGLAGSVEISSVVDKTNLSMESQIGSKSAISVESDLNGFSNVIIEKDSSLVLPIASLTKLMTAVVALDNYNLSDTAVVSKIADSQVPIKKDVKEKDVLIVESFLKMMLVSSSNKSAYTLAEISGVDKFVSLMNKKAQVLGLKDTYFVDPTGLSASNVSTANDLVVLTEYILKKYPIVSDISRSREIFVPGFGMVENTDQLLGEIPEAICSKTGFTTAAKGCLLVVVNNVKNSNYLINIVLGSDDRFSEMRNLINWSSEICQ